MSEQKANRPARFLPGTDWSPACQLLFHSLSVRALASAELHQQGALHYE